ncbi:MAG TPA: glucosamine-6-phosphate deaminase [Thermoanaerobaculia bacterium]|nr:glucosamine-6-phosphate deaminase [Thermoanaerobaculia bacterium]
MRWEVVEDAAALSNRAAHLLLDTVEQSPRTVLGLPTGRTPEGMYREVARNCRDPRCFGSVETFNLDEYVGIPLDHPGSYSSYMWTHLFSHVEVDRERIHIPLGDPERLSERFPGLSFEEALERECRDYEEEIRAAGGLDLTFLGLGRNGHIAFNEPGTPFVSRTHVIELTESTRRANAGCFPDREVPRRAMTMGIATIVDSKRIVLLATGGSKAEAVRRLASGEIGEDFPASALHRHPDVLVLTDREAAGGVEMHSASMLRPEGATPHPR